MTDAENPELFDVPDNTDDAVPDEVPQQLPTEAEPKSKPKKRTYAKRVAKIPATDDTTLQAEPAPIPEPAVAAPVEKKPKRKLSPEQYERLCNQLKVGRATGLEKRKKNAKLKAIAKEEKNQEEDERIFQSLAKKRAPTKLQAENDALKAEMAEMRKNAKTVKSIPEEVKVKVENKKVEEKVNKVEVVAPPVKKQLSNRDRLKLLKGL